MPSGNQAMYIKYYVDVRSQQKDFGQVVLKYNVFLFLEKRKRSAWGIVVLFSLFFKGFSVFLWVILIFLISHSLWMSGG